MNTANNVAARNLTASSGAIHDVLNRVRAVLLRIDAWLRARQRVTRDRGELARMSDRDLLDIGIDPGSVRPTRDHHWLTDPLP